MSRAIDYIILDCPLEMGPFPNGPYCNFFEYSNKILKINLGTSNKKETLIIYVGNVFISNRNKFVNIGSLAGDNYRIV